MTHCRSIMPAVADLWSVFAPTVSLPPVTALSSRGQSGAVCPLWKHQSDLYSSGHIIVCRAAQRVNDTLCLSSLRNGNTAQMLRRSTPSTSPMWSEVWPRSAAAAPWPPLRPAPPVFPARRDTTWSMGRECVRAALQTPSSGPISLSERLLVFSVDQTQRETR